MKDSTNATQSKVKHHIAWIIIAIIIFIILFITLPFHYTLLDSHGYDNLTGITYIQKKSVLKVFPKEYLSFNNTFIFQEDVDKLVDRYNRANFFEKQSINQEPLYRKLKEEGIIIKESSQKSSDEPDSENETDPKKIIFISANVLYNKYKENTVSADMLYKNKILCVEGSVYKINSNNNEINVELARWVNNLSGWDYQYINCTFSNKHKNEIAKLQKGQTIKIQGRCIGQGYLSINLINCTVIYSSYLGDDNISFGEKVPTTGGKKNTAIKYNNDILSVNKAFIAWEKKLIDKQIFDYVSEKDCENEDLMFQLYDKGKYPMHTSEKTLIEFDYNDDGMKDYILNYTLVNCLGGNGWSTDFIFLISKNNQLYVNEHLTNTIKKKYYDYVSKNYTEDVYVRYDKGFLITQSLIINNVVDSKCFGEFSLSQGGSSCCPLVSGSFSFDIMDEQFEVYNVKNKDYNF